MEDVVQSPQLLVEVVVGLADEEDVVQSPQLLVDVVLEFAQPFQLSLPCPRGKTAESAGANNENRMRALEDMPGKYIANV